MDSQPAGQVVTHRVECECCGGRGIHGLREDPLACGSRVCEWCGGSGKVKRLFRIPSGTLSLESFSPSHAEASSIGRA